MNVGLRAFTTVDGCSLRIWGNAFNLVRSPSDGTTEIGVKVYRGHWILTFLRDLCVLSVARLVSVLLPNVET